MPEPRDYQTEAIIIKKIKLGEADRILTLCTPRLGKIHAVAKGVRRPKSKMAGHLELLTHTQVSLASGRNLDTITGCQTINSYFPLKSDLELTSCGLYLAELTDQFIVDRQENNGVFVLLRDTLERLCQVNNRDILLRYFEMKLLNETGFRPQLQQCVKCHKPMEPVTNYFTNNAGGLLCPGCSQDRQFLYPLSVNAVKILRILQSEDFSYAGKLKISTELAYELKEVIRRYIRYLLEREVKSIVFLDSL
jgi:DNA repair protein RecO (recombination protein O)